MYLGVRQGTVDGVEATLHLIAKSKMPEVAKYATITRQSWLPMIVSINLAQYKTLPPDLQELLSKTAVEAMARSWDEEKLEEVKYEQELKSAGMEVIQLSPDAIASFQAAAKTLDPEFADIVGQENLLAFQNP